MGFEFAGPGRIVFERGGIAKAGDLARSLGSRALVLTGRDIGRAMPLLDILELTRMPHVPLSVPPEPDIEALEDCIEQARVYSPDLVIGFGGGSVLDMAKALAALMTNKGDPLDYLEVVGKGKALGRPSLPCIAVPTTAGTGSEATRNAVFSARGEGGGRVKVSMRSPSMLPSVALVDPGLCLGLPPRLTADSGMDAVTQLVEPLVSARANPIVDGLCREGLRRAATALPRAFADGEDADAREDMSFASLAGGLALANAGLGAVHGLAGPLGGLVGAPHGAVCAALLSPVVSANVRALTRALEKPGEAADRARGILDRYGEVARLFGSGSADPEGAADALEALAASLDTRGLGELGLSREDFEAVVGAARRSSSMKANPVELSEEELLAVLDAAY